MAHHIVTFDLQEAGIYPTSACRDLQAYRIHWPLQGTVWVVMSDKPPREVFGQILAGCELEDEFYVECL